MEEYLKIFCEPVPDYENGRFRTENGKIKLAYGKEAHFEKIRLRGFRQKLRPRDRGRDREKQRLGIGNFRQHKGFSVRQPLYFGCGFEVIQL